MRAMKMIEHPSNTQNATMCCCRNDARSTSSRSTAGGDADGGGASCGTKRGRIASVIFPLVAAFSN